MTNEIVLYKPDEQFQLEVRLQDETVWLTQQQMVALFDSTKQNISLHINNIYKEGELQKEATVKEYLTVQNEGRRQVTRNVRYYNLYVIISLHATLRDAHNKTAGVESIQTHKWRNASHERFYRP